LEQIAWWLLDFDSIIWEVNYEFEQLMAIRSRNDMPLRKYGVIYQHSYEAIRKYYE